MHRGELGIWILLSEFYKTYLCSLNDHFAIVSYFIFSHVYTFRYIYQAHLGQGFHTYKSKFLFLQLKWWGFSVSSSLYVSLFLFVSLYIYHCYLSLKICLFVCRGICRPLSPYVHLSLCCTLYRCSKTSDIIWL